MPHPKSQVAGHKEAQVAGVPVEALDEPLYKGPHTGLQPVEPPGPDWNGFDWKEITWEHGMHRAGMGCRHASTDNHR